MLFKNSNLDTKVPYISEQISNTNSISPTQFAHLLRPCHFTSVSHTHDTVDITQLLTWTQSINQSRCQFQVHEYTHKQTTAYSVCSMHVKIQNIGPKRSCCHGEKRSQIWVRAKE